MSFLYRDNVACDKSGADNVINKIILLYQWHKPVYKPVSNVVLIPFVMYNFST